MEASAGSTAGKEKMRSVYERALSAGGLHLSEGSKLWAAARQVLFLLFTVCTSACLSGPCVFMHLTL